MSIQQKNLKEFGFEEGCKSFGNPTQFKSTVDQINNGSLLDSNIVLSSSIDNKPILIAKLKDELSLLQDKKNEQENKKSLNLSRIKKVESDLELLRINPEDPSVVGEKGPFNSAKFFPLLIVFLGLTVFLFYYYSAIPYESFIKVCDQNTKMFPSFKEWIRAILGTEPILIFIPMVFFSFGIAIHFALTYKLLIKVSLLFFLVVITFFLDIRMAMSIYECVSLNQFNNFGITIPKWYESGIVYLHIMLGFVTFFLWSFLYHTLLLEWSKRNIIKDLQREKYERLKEVEVLELSITSFKGKITSKLNNISAIEQNNGPIATVQQIQQSIDYYKSGFYEIFSMRNTSDFNSKKQECENYLTINSTNLDR